MIGFPKYQFLTVSYNTIIVLNELIGSFCPFQKNVLLVAVNFHEDHYWMLIVRQSFQTSHFFRFCWKPVPKLIANDQNKEDRQWLGGGG